MRELTGSEYTDDDGSPTPGLPEALAGYDADPEAGRLPALGVLAGARVLVPVVAVLGEVEYDEAGRARDKTSDMAAVLLRRSDGRTGLLAFSSVETMRAWDPAARPMPVSMVGAAQTALTEGAVAVVVDVAGPVQFVVDGEDLVAVANQWRLVRVGQEQWGWLAPAPDSSSEPTAGEGAD